MGQQQCAFDVSLENRFDPSGFGITVRRHKRNQTILFVEQLTSNTHACMDRILKASYENCKRLLHANHKILEIPIGRRQFYSSDRLSFCGRVNFVYWLHILLRIIRMWVNKAMRQFPMHCKCSNKHFHLQANVKSKQQITFSEEYSFRFHISIKFTFKFGRLFTHTLSHTNIGEALLLLLLPSLILRMNCTIYIKIWNKQLLSIRLYDNKMVYLHILVRLNVDNKYVFCYCLFLWLPYKSVHNVFTWQCTANAEGRAAETIQVYGYHKANYYWESSLFYEHHIAHK